MYPNQWHTRASRLLGGAVLLAAPLAIAGTGVASAAGPDGNNGTVKVHNVDTPADDMRNEPKGCEFYFVGSKFDGAQQVTWEVRDKKAEDRPVVLDGELTLDEDGHGRTDDLTLPTGHYKLYWYFDGNGDSEKGADDKGKKHKVFKVECENGGDDEGDDGDKPEPTPPPEDGDEGEEKPPAEDDGKDEDEGDQDGTAPPEEPEEGSESDEESPDTEPAGNSDDSDDSEADEAASGGLPVTGAALGGLVAAAAAALGGGGAVMYAARKRKAGQDDSPVSTEES
ncbi:hypothetical protein F4561_000330 [Lipingzhangella halophila]|uniref:LPXTG-motif cell wall-anchored protein n=1 Tax=Lipingzhangella halophila TaxID=1783352 RepID=A0A7W7RCU7_9ACTN|nr:hypothetical protein [Lipingzhangella halophila]MBB4929510.1 hypothetical protein [Lipingzhangella halophila]